MIKSVVILSFLFINFPFSLYSMDHPRYPSIPKEWMTPKEDEEKGNWLTLTVDCKGSNKGGYIVVKNVSKEDKAILLGLINADLEKSKIGKKFHQLTREDAFALQKAVRNGSFQYSYNYEENGKYCYTNDFKNQIDQETKGVFQEVLNNESIVGNSKSNLGNVVYLPSYILNQFYDSVGESNVILDIGGSRGIQTAPLLYQKKDVTVLDLSGEDLNHLVKTTPMRFRSYLKTIEAKFPNDPNLKHLGWEEKYDVILMSHVAHYLTGEELHTGIKTIYSWLQHEGRFYFQALTPYSAPYCWRMALHDNLSINPNHVWPGYFTIEEKVRLSGTYPQAHIPMLSSMPNDGHPIHPSVIKRELENNGFTILYLNYGTFTPNLAGERYPISYEDLEKYVKRKITPISREEEARIKKAIEEFDNQRFFKLKGNEETTSFSRLLDIVERDAVNYALQYRQGLGCQNPIRSMETVQVLAYKK